MKCPNCNKYIEIWRLERLLSPFLASKCKSCGSRYTAVFLKWHESLFLSVMLLPVYLAFGEVSLGAAIVYGIAVGLAHNVLTRLVPEQERYD